jgi:hypothetical protein
MIRPVTDDSIREANGVRGDQDAAVAAAGTAADADTPGASSAEAGAMPETRPPGQPSRTATRGPMTVADFERASSERSQLARARGLAAPYIAGGEDPDPERTRREERIYVRLLVLMVAAIVIGGFALSIVGLIVLGGSAPA